MVHSLAVPVPRFVQHAPGVVARKRQAKPEVARMRREPGKGIAVLKHLFQMFATWRTDIHGTPAVMFAESRCGIDLQNVGDALSARQFARDQLLLVLVT